jgi:integrase
MAAAGSPGKRHAFSTERKAVEQANEKLVNAGDVPLPEGLTPHKLRHTFASIMVALGVDPGSVMDQLGHADPGARKSDGAGEPAEYRYRGRKR